MKKILTAGLCFGLAASHAQSSSYDDFRRQQEILDPAKYTRTRTNTLQGAETREYGIKLNAVKQLVFKDGILPLGGTLRGGDKDNVFKAEARFGQFSDNLKGKIAAAMPEAARTNRPIEVEVVNQGVQVSVTSVKLSNSQVPLAQANQNQRGNSISQNQNQPNISSLGLNQPRSVNMGPDASRAVATNPAGERGTAPEQKAAPAQRVRTTEVRGANERVGPLPRAGSENRGSLSDAARNLAGLVSPNAAPIRMEQRLPSAEANAKPIPVAIMAMSGGDVVVTKSQPIDNGQTRVTVEGNMQSMPQPLKDQMKNDVPKIFSQIRPATDVRAVVVLKPDNTFNVVSVQPISARNLTMQATVPPTPAILLAQVSLPNNAGPASTLIVPDIQAKTGVAVKTSQAAERTVVRTTVLQTPVVGVAPAASLANVAQSLARWMGANAGAIRIENRLPGQRNDTVPVAVVSLVGGGEIAVREMKTARGEVVYRAEAKLGDFSLEMKSQIILALDGVGGAESLSDDSRVAVDVKPGADNRFALTAVLQHTDQSDTRNTPGILLWAMGLDESRAEGDSRGVLNGSEPGQSTARAGRLPADSRLRGLLPAVSVLVKVAYGLNAGDYKPRVDSKTSRLMIASLSQDRPLNVVEWSLGVQPGQYEFSVEDALKNFSDRVREEITAQLKAAAARGAEWAKKALEGNSDVMVEFLANENPDAAQVTVKSVHPPAEDAAQSLAREMGLGSNDFLIVARGQQAILALEKGVRTTIAMGLPQPIKIASPDGSVKILVKGDPTRKTGGLFMILSRAALKANASAIQKAGGAGAADVVAVALNGYPQADSFAVLLNPGQADGLQLAPIDSLKQTQAASAKKSSEAVWEVLNQ